MGGRPVIHYLLLTSDDMYLIREGVIHYFIGGTSEQYQAGHTVTLASPADPKGFRYLVTSVNYWDIPGKVIVSITEDK